MKNIPFVAVLAVALASFAVAEARAQSGSLPRNEKIIVDYQEPLNPEELGLDPNDQDKDTKETFEVYDAAKRVHDRLVERKFLERFAQFLAPLRLPTTLRLITKECKWDRSIGHPENAFFSPMEHSITMCLEYILGFERSAALQTKRDGIARDDLIVGALVATMLHEAGHAIFHILKIPVLGRNEDGADQVAAFVMLQFGDQVALTTIRGSLWKWRSHGIPLGATTSMVERRMLSDTHSTNQQRFLTFLCIAYGAKPSVFQPFIDTGSIPKSRAAACANDYKQVSRAFEKTVLPYIDKELMAKVQGAQWLFPQDMGIIPVQTR